LRLRELPSSEKLLQCPYAPDQHSFIWKVNQVPHNILANFVLHVRNRALVLFFYCWSYLESHDRIFQWCFVPVIKSGFGVCGFHIDGSQDTSFRRLYFSTHPNHGSSGNNLLSNVKGDFAMSKKNQKIANIKGLSIDLLRIEALDYTFMGQMILFSSSLKIRV